VPRKKSAKLAAQAFRKNADEVVLFAQAISIAGLSKQHVTWGHELAIIRLYREFETLMLEALVAAINNDTATISARAGLSFPKHLTDEVCEYLIVGTGYFDFKGRDGLVSVLKKYVPDTHYLVVAVKKAKYKTALERLTALRNFAAHGSAVSKSGAMTAVGAKRLATAGAWLKVSGRLQQIVDPLKELADDIEAAAPY
jgi:hypothetical protein